MDLEPIGEAGLPEFFFVDLMILHPDHAYRLAHGLPLS
jgi:hypothetical protein